MTPVKIKLGDTNVSVLTIFMGMKKKTTEENLLCQKLHGLVLIMAKAMFTLSALSLSIYISLKNRLGKISC